jgi:3-mercaptopyruvate sulfurtransferase SseA
MTDYAKDVLVETQWVEDHLNDDSIRIVEVDENPALYAEAHIPGAIGFDWKKDLQDQVKRDFLGPKEFGALFGARGISNAHTNLLYGPADPPTDRPCVGARDRRASASRPRIPFPPGISAVSRADDPEYR